MQEVLGDRAPPVRVRFVVPLNCDPAPQTSFMGRTLVVRPDKAAPRSSVKEMFVVLLTVASFPYVTVNSRFAVPPGSTGSSVNTLLSRGPATTSRPSAKAHNI